MSEELLDDIMMDRDTLMEVKPETDRIVLDGPHHTSPGWSDWVMSLFEEDEMFDGYPKADGLRRVAELVVGEIVESGPVSSWTTPPIDGIPGAATHWQIVFSSHSDGRYRTFGDVGDSTAMNSEDAFVRFALATSATRAEARALRKALKLKKCSAEELTDLDVSEVKKARTVSKYETVNTGEVDEKDSTNTTGITDRQAGFLISLCKEMNINITKAYSELVNVPNKESINKANTTSLLSKLKSMRSNPGSVPGTIFGYEDWSME